MRDSKEQDLNGREFVGDVPSFAKVGKYFRDEELAIKYLHENGCIDIPAQCQRCKSPVKADWKRHRARCRKPACNFKAPKTCEMCDQPMMKPPPGVDRDECPRKCSNTGECNWIWKPGMCYQQSFFRGSIFASTTIPKNKILHLLYLWLLKTPPSAAAKMLRIGEGTAGKCMRHMRQMVVEMLLSKGYYDSQVGGEGVIVELDESKFGKRKYNRGRKVKCDWVLGMVERTKERRMVLIVVPDRTRATLEPIIERFVAAGSTIHSDMWKAYDKLEEIEDRDYKLERLCHKYEFVSETGIHTQTIEANWRGVKAAIPLCMRSGHDLQEHLFEFMWRRQHAKNLWNGLFYGLRNVRFTAKMLKEAQDIRDIKCEDEDETWELPRNCRPRDVKFEVDVGIDTGDMEVMAAAAMVGSSELEAACRKRDSKEPISRVL